MKSIDNIYLHYLTQDDIVQKYHKYLPLPQQDIPEMLQNRFNFRFLSVKLQEI